VANFFSADFGWLCGHDGAVARETIRPGARRDGYFEGEDIMIQAKRAAKIVNETWPEYDHIFVYDNATTHRKRAEGALSAVGIPKFPSGSRSKDKGTNFLLEVTRRGNDGKKYTEKVQMTGAHHNGQLQSLYFPPEHPTFPNKFKGMKQILIE
jgi:hypothetical protein